MKLKEKDEYFELKANIEVDFAKKG
jgi:hypothetical protein